MAMTARVLFCAGLVRPGTLGVFWGSLEKLSCNRRVGAVEVWLTSRKRRDDGRVCRLAAEAGAAFARRWPTV